MINSKHFQINLKKVFKRFFQTYKTEILPKGGKAFINGKWVDASDGRIFEVKNKFSRELLCDVSNCGVQEAELATVSAHQSFQKWAYETTPKERSIFLQKWYEVLKEKETQLAELLTLEQGKPLAESRGEIQYSSSFIEWYAGEARRIYGQVVTPAKLNCQHLHVREPIGVVAVITPWNFPSAMIARKAGAALAAGCTLVVKPAEETPLSALALAETAYEAGLPNGVFNVIPADRESTAEISKYFCDSNLINCISFTGSTAVGKLLFAQSASTLKRLCLELGGNAPFIVFNSACVKNAVQSAIMAKFRCSGQACIAANRFYIQSNIYDSFITNLIEAVTKLKCGNGLDKNITLGPIINQNSLYKITRLVDNAIAKGAKLVYGGKLAVENSTLYEPTILTDVPNNAEILNEEIFGPVIAIQKFENEDDVLKKANNSRSGLAGYFFSKDLSQIHRVSSKLQVGMIGVNEGMISCAESAFGGIKESGLGREGGTQGIDEFTQWKYVLINLAV